MSKDLTDMAEPDLRGAESNNGNNGCRKIVTEIVAQQGDLVSITLKEGCRLSKDRTLVEKGDGSTRKAISGYITGTSKVYIYLGQGVPVDEEGKPDLETLVPRSYIDSYRVLRADMSKPFMH